MGQPRDFKKRNKWLYHALTKKSLTLKYLHIVAKEDPQARTVGSLVVHDGSQLSTCSPGYICKYRKAFTVYSGSLGISLYLELFCLLSFISFVLRKLT